MNKELLIHHVIIIMVILSLEYSGMGAPMYFYVVLLCEFSTTFLNLYDICVPEQKETYIY